MNSTATSVSSSGVSDSVALIAAGLRFASGLLTAASRGSWNGAPISLESVQKSLATVTGMDTEQLVEHAKKTSGADSTDDVTEYFLPAVGTLIGGIADGNMEAGLGQRAKDWVVSKHGAEQVAAAGSNCASAIAAVLNDAHAGITAVVQQLVPMVHGICRVLSSPIIQQHPEAFQHTVGVAGDLIAAAHKAVTELCDSRDSAITSCYETLLGKGEHITGLPKVEASATVQHGDQIEQAVLSAQHSAPPQPTPKVAVPITEGASSARALTSVDSPPIESLQTELSDTSSQSQAMGTEVPMPQSAIVQPSTSEVVTPADSTPAATPVTIPQDKAQPTAIPAAVEPPDPAPAPAAVVPEPVAGCMPTVAAPEMSPVGNEAWTSGRGSARKAGEW